MIYIQEVFSESPEYMYKQNFVVLHCETDFF